MSPEPTPTTAMSSSSCHLSQLWEITEPELAAPVFPYHSAFEDSLGALYGWQGVVPDNDGDYDELRVLLDAIGFGIDDI